MNWVVGSEQLYFYEWSICSIFGSRNLSADQSDLEVVFPLHSLPTRQAIELWRRCDVTRRCFCCTLVGVAGYTRLSVLEGPYPLKHQRSRIISILFFYDDVIVFYYWILIFQGPRREITELSVLWNCKSIVLHKAFTIESLSHAEIEIWNLLIFSYEQL